CRGRSIEGRQCANVVPAGLPRSARDAMIDLGHGVVFAAELCPACVVRSDYDRALRRHVAQRQGMPNGRLTPKELRTLLESTLGGRVRNDRPGAPVRPGGPAKPASSTARTPEPPKRRRFVRPVVEDA